MSEVRILFHNCYGLNTTTLSQYNLMMRQNMFDLIILQEHWFLNFDQITTSPFFVASSDKPFTPIGRTCRNGVLILANHALRQRISILKKTFYSIAFTIDDFMIDTSYLPPSLTSAQVIGE